MDGFSYCTDAVVAESVLLIALYVFSILVNQRFLFCRGKIESTN